MRLPLSILTTLIIAGMCWSAPSHADHRARVAQVPLAKMVKATNHWYHLVGKTAENNPKRWENRAKIERIYVEALDKSFAKNLETLRSKLRKEDSKTLLAFAVKEVQDLQPLMVGAPQKEVNGRSSTKMSSESSSSSVRIFGSSYHSSSSSFSQHQWTAALIPDASSYKIPTIDPNSVTAYYAKSHAFKSNLHARLVTGRLVELAAVIRELAGRETPSPAVGKRKAHTMARPLEPDARYLLLQ